VQVSSFSKLLILSAGLILCHIGLSAKWFVELSALIIIIESQHLHSEDYLR